MSRNLKILAISGSTRSGSSNTALLKALSTHAPFGISVELFSGLQTLPIFSPDLESAKTPEDVIKFCELIAGADGLVVSSPEYVHAIPRGLKNAIDWLVSREEIIRKPVALVHASHRGEDMLASLRLVISTVSECFAQDIFLRFPLISKTEDEMSAILSLPESVSEIRNYLLELASFIRTMDN